jgi:RES domain-containing protein
MHYSGKLYRALNPVWVRDPLSGQGAALYGGRFNAKGTDALYCSLTVMTAIREANQAGDLQPTVLVAYDADIAGIFDSRDPLGLVDLEMDAAALTDPAWRDRMKASGEAPTQAFARQLMAAGYYGLLVPSYARGAGTQDLNIVLWRWGDAPPCRLTLIDDEGRLGARPQ